jgi:hypothetical protein
VRHLHMKSKIVAIAVVVLLLGSGIVGCAMMEQFPNSEKQQTREAEEAYFQEGVMAFERGDYSDASKHFEKLTHTSKNDEIRRKALYGAACIELLEARDAQQISAAMVHWNLWSRTRPINAKVEDPRMLTPFLDRVASFVETNNFENAEKLKGILAKKEAENKNLRDQLAAAKAAQSGAASSKSCKEKLKTKDKQIEELKKQIEGLEEIHREIQEKKKEVSPQ